MGESYIYRPTFYKFSGDTTLIVCEHGYEYSTGVDIYELSKSRIRKLGSINIATDEENGTSIVPNLRIEVGEKIDRYEFLFDGNVVVDPGMTTENRLNGEKLVARFNEQTGVISLMVKR
jgi:hypothetical protein